MESISGPHFLKVAVNILRNAAPTFLRLSSDFKKVEVLQRDKQYVYSSLDSELAREIYRDIIKSFPTHSIERNGKVVKAGSDFTWIVEPASGVENLLRGISLATMMLGLKHQGKMVVSVVYQPFTNQLFTALQGVGSSLNYRRIRINPNVSSKFLTASNFSFSEASLNLRCTPLHICYTASGYVDLTIASAQEANIEIPNMILKEAGGIISVVNTHDMLMGHPSAINQYLLQHSKKTSDLL